MVAVFSVTDQALRVRFFEEIFPVANVSPDIAFGILFFSLSYTHVNFPKKELQQRFYTIEKVFSTIKRVALVDKKEFTSAALDPGYEIFVIHITFLKSPSNNQKSDIHLFRRVPIFAFGSE